MAMTKDKSQELIEGSKKHEKDTGSSEVQITLLTERINYLTQHFREHKKDHHSAFGLRKLVSRRKALLKYLQKKDMDAYKAILKKLNLRK